MVEYTLAANNYLSWYWLTNHFSFNASVQIDGAVTPQDQWWTGTHADILVPQYSFLQVTPTNPVVGNVVTAKVYHINPFMVPAHNTEVMIKAKVDLKTAKERLKTADGFVRKAIEG